MRTDWIPFGFLPVDKQVGPTSHDMVARVRRLCPRKTKVGHTGTLDPFASGVMLIGIGKATRFSDEVHKLTKSYTGVIRLGVETDTLDHTGKILQSSPVPDITPEDLKTLTERFTGTYSQIPPAYSAKRVEGKKSYQLARKDQAVPLAPKTVTIHDLQLDRVDASHLRCSLTCGTGTYVRSLARDLAEALGTYGHLISLERTAVGPVRQQDCAQIQDLDSASLSKWLIPVSELLPDYPERAIDEAMFTHFLQGRAFPAEAPYPPQFLGVHRDDDGHIKGIFLCQFQPAPNQIQPRMICYSSQPS